MDKKIIRFLDSVMARAEECALVLYLVNTSGRKVSIWVSEKGWSVSDANHAIAEFAQGCTDSVQGISRFTLQAFEQDKVISTTAFILRPKDINGDDISFPESPCTDSLLAQLMRHNADLHDRLLTTVEFFEERMQTRMRRTEKSWDKSEARVLALLSKVKE